jgi:hypothetical protein
MSVNRNANIIKALKPEPKDPIRYNFSASLWAIGGGGGGFENPGGNVSAGGGGGAGAVVSSSISISPNITWNIEVGAGGSGSFNGQDTYAIAYNNDYDGLVTFRAQGGRKGSLGVGGNTGTGSLEINETTQSYSAFTGGANVTGGGRNSAGGGAGVAQNGGTGSTYDGNPGSGFGGQGGAGLNNTNQLALPIIGPIAGGGGGGAGGDIGNGGNGQNGGGSGGNNATFDGTNAFTIGSGGGGAGGTLSGDGGRGFDGRFVISFTGKIGTQLNQFDIETTNAVVLRDEPSNTTVIVFITGNGTFRYNAPFPYDKRP